MRAIFASILVVSAGLTVASVAVMSSAGDRAARTLEAGATTHTPGSTLLADTDRAARSALQGSLQVAINNTDEVRGAAYGALESFAGQRTTFEARASQFGVTTADVDAFTKLAGAFSERCMMLVRTPTDRDTYLAACEAFALLNEHNRKVHTAFDTSTRSTLAAAHGHTQLWTGVSITVGLLGAAGMIAGVAGFMHAWRKDSQMHRGEIDVLTFASQEAANTSRNCTAALAQLADQFAPALDGMAIYATQLGLPDASPGERTTVANGLAVQSRAMGNTLLALRDFINADAGLLALQRVAVPTAPCVRETIDALMPHMPEGTGLRIDVDKSVPQRVLFDRDRLRLAIASMVSLGADEACGTATQAEAWRMAPTPEGENLPTAASTDQEQPQQQPTWIGSHLAISFDASAGQLVFTLRTPARDINTETLHSRLSPLSDVTLMKDPSWRRWLDLAIVDRLATQSGGQSFTCSTIESACILTTRIHVGVAENTSTLAEAITIEFGTPMPRELREPAKTATATLEVSSQPISPQAGDNANEPSAQASETEQLAASIPVTDVNVALPIDCSDAADLNQSPARHKAA